MEGRSTVTTLIKCTDDWFKALENGQEVCAIFFNFRIVSFPDPTLCEGKRGLMNLDCFLGLAGSVHVHHNCCTETNLGSDWSVLLLGCRPTIQINLYSRQWCFAFLWLASCMTALKLQSHWSAQIPFPGPRIVSKFTRPLFPRRGWGLGTRLLQESFRLCSYPTKFWCKNWPKILQPKKHTRKRKSTKL